MPIDLSALNPEQHTAVTHKTGPLMIIAGAGTGKTTVITKRVAWLIEQGAKPEEILALTFTEKAATEMEERIDELLPIGYLETWISTFHAFCERVLRAHAVEIGLANDFTLLDEVQTLLTINRNLDKFTLDYYKPKSNPTRFIKAIINHISRAKDEGVTPNDYHTFAESLRLNDDIAEADKALSEPAKYQELASAYHTYQQIMLENNALDFADLIAYTLELLKTRPNIREHYQTQFKHILVDEFQDTNSSQYELVKLLINKEQNITIVGDDDQSIYKFRGASLSNILSFKSDFPQTTTVVLTTNYRSKASILNAAYSLIQNNNPNRLEAREGLNKELKPHKEGEGFVRHLIFPTLEDEIDFTIQEILTKKEASETNWGDFAILVRANAHATELVNKLDQIGAPYTFQARAGLYTQPIILDILAYFRAIAFHHDSISIYRILAHPELGLAHKDIANIALTAKQDGSSLYKAMTAKTPEDTGTAKRLQSITTTIDQLHTKSRRAPITELYLEVLKQTGILGHVGTLPEIQQAEQYDYLQQFLTRLKSFESNTGDKTLTHFLEEFEHERQAGETGALSTSETDHNDAINIMTIHGSKGLEFPYVFIINLIEQRFPSRARPDAIPLPQELITSNIDHDHVEEERRLFYVAITRAKEGLYLLAAKDYGGKRTRKPSRFLQELNIQADEGESQKDITTQTTIETPLPSSQKGHELKRVSFTQLAAFAKCPLQYKFAHILRIPIFGKHQMSFGKTMHNTLQHFFESGAGDTQTSLFESAPQSDIPSLKNLLALYDQNWINEWYPSDAIRDEYRKKGRESLIEYHTQITATPPTVAFIEKPFTIKIGDITIKGRIDRIDKINNAYKIVDYKTGNPKKDGKLNWDDKKQLILYAIAAEKCFDPPLHVTELEYHYLENNSTVSFEPKDKLKERLIEEIKSSVEAIKSSDFKPTPGFGCNYCDFKDICEFAQT